MNWTKSRLATKYITFEILPTFLLGLSVFVLVLIMFQSFNLSEYVIVHGVRFRTISQLVFYVSLGYLPILLPIALLFSILMVYGRMSGDSEIVAFKALGLSSYQLMVPSLIIGIVVSVLSLQVSFRLAPWGHRNLKELINVLAQTKPGAAIKEGVFSQDFFDLVVYANKVDTRSGTLQKIFIYDERDAKAPITIIAKDGQIVNRSSIEGNEAYLHLAEGSVHKSANEFYTKIDFSVYDINLYDPHKINEAIVQPESLNLSELNSAIDSATDKEKLQLVLERSRRLAFSFTCIVFALLGFSISAMTNRRTAKSGSMVICISTVVIFWTMQVIFESLSRKGHLPPFLGVWSASLLVLLYTLFQIKKLAKN